jgi:hypothetical protein
MVGEGNVMRLRHPVHPPPPKPLWEVTATDIAWFAIGFAVTTVVLAWLRERP